MQSYIPNTSDEQIAMLEAIGLRDMSDLFDDVPIKALMSRPLDIGPGLSEIEVKRAFKLLAPDADKPLFRGAGAYRHFIPAVVEELSHRSEFYTAYTPYQAEMSQGMLQSIFEYQTLICQLTGMEVSNASVYDGASACAETLVMLRANTRKSKVLVSAGLHPEYRAVIDTYARFSGFELVTVPLNAQGVTDMEFLKANAAGAAGALIPNPNFFGCVENLQAIADVLHENRALLAAVVNPISLGLLKRPGDAGADIALGEGQPLGMPLSMGGPYLGFMATTRKYMRTLPGRIVGQTSDAEGNRVFVLTLQAREQHIRREKAPSNICSNQSLCAMQAAMYLAAMGPKGMREVAQLNLQRAHYLKDGILTIKGMKMRYPDAPFFHEFVIESEKDPVQLNQRLLHLGFIGGLELCRYFPNDKGILYCATEMNARDEIDAFLNALEVSTR